MAGASERPRLRQDLYFRPEPGGALTALVDPEGRALARLAGPEVAVASVLDGEMTLGDLAETARAVGLGSEGAVIGLIDRLHHAGCLDATPSEAASTALVPAGDEMMRRAVILATRGLDGSARRVLAEIDQRDPGRPGVEALLAVLDEAAIEGAAEDDEAIATELHREAQAPRLLPPPPTFTLHSAKAPARLGTVGRRRLKYLGIAVGGILVLSLIPLRGSVYGPATLRPEQAVVLVTPRDGMIQQVAIDDGAAVRTGQLLVQLLDGPARTQVASAEAVLASRKANYEMLARGPTPGQLAEVRAAAGATAQAVAQAQATCRGVHEQVAAGVLPRSEQESCERRVAAARTQASSARAALVAASGPGDPGRIASALASVRAAEQALAHDREELDALAVHSPIDGRVIAPGLRARAGSHVTAGDEILRVVTGRWVRAAILLPPEDAGLVEPGAKVSVRARALGHSQLVGRVVSVAGRAEPDETGVPRLAVEARLLASKPLRVIDLPATAEIHGERSTLLVAILRRFIGWVRVRVLPSLTS